MRYLAAAALLLAISCGDPTEPTTSSITGTWSLETVNGSSLPYTYPGSTATNKFEILSGTVTFASAGTYSASFSSRTTINGSAQTSTDTDTGTWTLSGAVLTVKSNEVGSTSQNASVTGNTFSITTTDNGVSFTEVYKKQ